MVDRPAHVPAQPLFDAALRDERRHHNKASIAQAETVVCPRAAGSVDRLRSELLAVAIREPLRHVRPGDAELARVRVEASLVAVVHRHSCIT